MWQVGKITPDGADDRGGTHVNAGGDEAEAAAAAPVDIWGGAFKLVRAQALMRGWLERRAVRKVRSQKMEEIVSESDMSTRYPNPLSSMPLNRQRPP